MDSFKMIVQRFMADLPAPADGEDADTSGCFVIFNDSEDNDADGVTVDIDSAPVRPVDIERGEPPIRRIR